jgi:hypothetical protein
LETQETENSQGNTLINVGGITIPNFKVIPMKTASYWPQSRYEDHWNRIVDPNMNPHSYAHLIFDKGAKNIEWKIDSSTNVAGKSGYLPAEN